METTTSQHGASSDGGGGGPSGLLLRALRDGARLHRTHPAHDGPPDPGESPGPQEALLVLSLDQIRATRSSNEYTEGPTVAPRPPASQPSQQKSQLLTPPTAGLATTNDPASDRPRTNQNRTVLPQNQRNNATHSRDAPPSRPPSEDSRGGGGGDVVRTGQGVAPESPAPGGGGERIVRSQPKRVELKQEELKPLAGGGGGGALVVAVPGAAGDKLLSEKHGPCCKDCGRCTCPECTRPRALPSCWTCGRRCVCSAQNAVEYGSCVCCVKGLFYHCSSDDEDTCADKPFSCSQSHCCIRWSAIGLLSVFLPCLLCYLPAKGCLTVCQSCYDLAKRPGCRCKNTNSKCLGLLRDT